MLCVCKSLCYNHCNQQEYPCQRAVCRILQWGVCTPFGEHHVRRARRERRRQSRGNHCFLKWELYKDSAISAILSYVTLAMC